LIFEAKTSSLPPVPKDLLPPSTLGQAKRSPWWSGFEGAIRSELKALEDNKTWDAVDRSEVPRGRNILRSKFVFDIKRVRQGKFKARLVAMGFSEVEGVDFLHTHASVMATKTFRILLAFWNYEKTLGLEHWDVKTAFVNAPLDETIFVHPVPGYEGVGGPGKIFKLKKALYGLKQSAWAWQQYLSKKKFGMGAKRHLNDECLYIFREGDAWVLIGTHVDDMFPLVRGGPCAIKFFQHFRST
jgi:hypothetical protein